MKPRKILKSSGFQRDMAPFLGLFILVNLALTANGVCLWQNGKLECQFHQSEVLQPGASGSGSDSSNPSSSLGPSAGAVTGASARSDAARLLWSSGGSSHQNSRYHPHQHSSARSPPIAKPKVVRISQHRPSPTQPSSPFSHRFLPFIDTEDEDLVSVSKVQVHEPDAHAQPDSAGQYQDQHQQAQQQQAYQSYPQTQAAPVAVASIDGLNYGGGLSPIEVSHIAWSPHEAATWTVGTDGRTDFHDHDRHTQNHDAPPPPRRLDSEIEDIHSILPSLLDPVKIKKLIYPKSKHARLHAQKYGRSFDGHSHGPHGHEQVEQQPLNVGQGEPGVGHVEPEAIPSHNVYESSYTQMESHDHVPVHNPNRGNPQLQNSKTLSSPLLLHGAATKKKPKPFRIQILDGKQEHQKPGTGSSPYGPYNKKSTLLVPATKAYHEQYNVPYKMNSENQMYAGEYSHATSGLEETPTQLVPINHNVYFSEQEHHQEQFEQQPQLQFQHSENLNAPSPTPVYSTGPIVVHDEHQAAELKPIEHLAQQPHQYIHDRAEEMPPPLPRPLAYHASFPEVEDQMMAESINSGHGHGHGQGQGFYHQQQYVGATATPAPFASEYAHGANPSPSPNPYQPHPYPQHPPVYPQQSHGYNAYPPAPAPAAGPAASQYYPPNYHAPAPAPWSYNGQQQYNGYPYPHPHPYVHPHAYPTAPEPASTTTAAPALNEKESVLNALKTLSQSKPDLIKDVVSEHKHEGLGDDVVEFVSSQKENSNGDSATTTNQTGTHFYMKKGLGSKNKITVDASSVENPDPKSSMPIDQVLSLLLSNQKYSSSGKNYFKNSFTQEIESGTKNHPNELAKVLYDMGILQRIATGTLTLEQMELVNKLIDLNHQEAELEEEIEFYMDKNGKMRKKKPAKYIVPRTASRGSGERDQQRRSQSSYSAYDDKREEYEKRRRRPQSYQSPSYTYDRHGYDRSRERDRDRERESDRHRYEDRHHYRERERDMLLSPGHSEERRYHEQNRKPAASAPAPNMQAPAPGTAPINLNIIIPTDEPPKPQKSLNDAIPSDTLNVIATVELGQVQGQGHGQAQQFQQTGYSQFTKDLPIPPLPIPPILPHLTSVFRNHPFLQRMKDEWWKGVGSMLNDIQRTQLYNHFGVDPGYNFTAPATPLELQQSQMQAAATGVEHHHHYQGQKNGMQKSVMVQLLSAIGLLSSFMLLAFIGIQMQKGSGILSGLLPKRVHFRSPIQFINPNKLPAVKGKPAMGSHRPSKGHGHGHGQNQHHGGSSNSQEMLTQSMESLREKVLSGEQPYNLHIHFKGKEIMTSAEKKKEQHGDGVEGMAMGGMRPADLAAEQHDHDEDFEDDNSDDDDDDEDDDVKVGKPASDSHDLDSSADTDDDEEDEHDRPLKLRTTVATETASDPVPGTPTTKIPFDESFESYLKQAAKIKLVNNPELLVRQFVKPTAAAAPLPVPVYRRPSPPTTAATSSTTTTTTSTTTTTTTPAPTTSPAVKIVFIAPAMHTEPSPTSTTTTTTTTTKGPQELIESEETIITNTIVPNAEDDRAAETTPTPRS